jgi:hypothetical protein
MSTPAKTSSFYVLDGEFEWLIGDEIQRGGPQYARSTADTWTPSRAAA